MSDRRQKATTVIKIEADAQRRYNCGPARLTGDANALYERHLTFDNVVPLACTTLRDKYIVLARDLWEY
jgi:starch phosphorylase